MNYPEWWQRLLAGLIDGVILAIVMFIISAMFGALAGYNLSVLRVMLLLAAIINTGLVVGYKVFFEGSAMQATPGKMVFGLKVVDAGGNRADLRRVIMRTWPWWLNLLNIIGALLLVNFIGFLVALIIIGIFCTFFMPPLGRCIHDQTADLHVI
ncbi:MAG: RDD family protein, partial [Alphaproteobacteria bacterium]